MTSQPLGPRFTDALITATQLHRRQRRKGTEIPYVSHLLAVAAIALKFGADEDEAIAALLHDAIEDAPRELGPEKALVVRRWLGMRCGDRVPRIVEACTDAETHPKPLWRARKEQYIESIAGKTASDVLVSVADKLHNARAILRDFHAHGEAVWERFNTDAGKAGTPGYYRGLVMAFEQRATQLKGDRLKPLIADLRHVVTTLEREVGLVGTWPFTGRDDDRSSKLLTSLASPMTPHWRSLNYLVCT